MFKNEKTTKTTTKFTNNCWQASSVAATAKYTAECKQKK